MTETTQNHTTMRDQLAEGVSGPVHSSAGEDYEQLRTGFQLLEPHEPAVAVEPTGNEDVRTAVVCAADRGTSVAVQATGHGRASAMRGGVLLNTRRMTGVDVDPATRTAWVQAGASWQDVIDAATPHGLAPLSGSLPGVGAVSYTLGGGVGLLARRYGFAADHVHTLEVVTLDGRLRRVTAADEPDLFWALRGGGGNFGVVTGMEIALLPVTSIYGGCLLFDLAEAPGVLQRWLEWTDAVDDAMTSAASVVPFPDSAAVPQPMRGRHVAQLQISYCGPAEQGRELLEPLRTLGPLLRDTVRELPYSESGAVFDEPGQPGGYRGSSVLLDGLDPRQLNALLGRVGPASPDRCVVGIRHLGGALAREPHAPNAVGHRDAAYSLGILSLLDPATADQPHLPQQELLAPFAHRVLGPSLNFSFGPLERHEIRAAFEPADYRRLAKLRAEYDPHGLLRPNHPIPPMGR